MATSKKRVGIYLPITPEEFEPIRQAFKDNGRLIGRVALKCLQDFYVANYVHSGERINDNNECTASKPTGGAR